LQRSDKWIHQSPPSWSTMLSYGASLAFTGESRRRPVLSSRPWAVWCPSGNMFWSHEENRGGKRSHAPAVNIYERILSIKTSRWPVTSAACGRCWTAAPRSQHPITHTADCGLSFSFLVVIIFFHKLLCRKGWWDKSVWLFDVSEMETLKLKTSLCYVMQPNPSVCMLSFHLCSDQPVVCRMLFGEALNIWRLWGSNGIILAQMQDMSQNHHF